MSWNFFLLLFFVIAAELFAFGHGFGHIFAHCLLFEIFRNIINGIFPVVELLVIFLLCCSCLVGSGDLR